MRGYVIIAALLGGTVAINRLDVRSNQSQLTLDLTSPATETQQGRSDMPGGGGNWHTGQKGNRFPLPLQIHIVSSSINKAGDLIVEILVKNTGGSSVDIPISRDINRVEKTASKLRSLFLVRAVPVDEFKLGTDSIGSGQTAGSLSIQGSLMRLNPSDSLRILIPVTSADLKRSFPKNGKPLGIRIVCEQWRLDDQRYFIDSASAQLQSTNMMVLEALDGKPTVLDH